MNIPRQNPRTCAGLIALACALAVGGCGTGDETLQAPADAGRVVRGNVSKGPLNEATIRVYEIDARGQRLGPALAETTTDAAGNWSVSLTTGAGRLVVESFGGGYVDEADPEPDPDRRRTIQLAAGDTFAALLPDEATTVAINVYTDALLRKSRHETQGANFFAVHEQNRSFLHAAFGFDITTTQPADPIRPDAGASLQARSYAMALGGAANVVNAVAIANWLPVANYEIISAIMDDLTDCRIDGHGVAGPVQGITTLTLNLNAEILRFRNNNYGAYRDTPLLQLDQSECARSGQMADTIAPDFVGLPGDFVVEAPDDQGIAAAAQTVQARLQGIQAIDDRDGAVAFTDDLPDFLPVGDTTVTYTASDLAGNTQTAALTVTVRLPQAPTIVAPADVVARATGELTPVYLGTPAVSDNVTGAAELVVENDAPRDGFAPGEHRVTWTVTDEAGFSAQASQQVNIGTVPGFDELPLTPPDYSLLPVFPDPNRTPVPPITVPRPNAAATGSGAAIDSDYDSLSDNLELALGTDPYRADSDADGVSDALEAGLMSDPLTASIVVHIPVAERPADHRFSFAGTRARTPAFIVYEPGSHRGRLQLTAPCDHVVVIGNTSRSGDPATQAVIGGDAGRSLSIAGCNDVRLYRLDITGATRGGIELIDSEATVSRSSFYSNSAARGGAIRLTRSRLTVEHTIMSGNVAAMQGGAIWIGPDSSVLLFDSLLEDNHSINDDTDHADSLLHFNASFDPAAIASQPR